MRARAMMVLASAFLLGGCAGENLFFRPVAGGSADPTVEITAPQDGFTLALGASVQILATVNAPQGLVSVAYSSAYVSGTGTPFQPDAESFARPSFANLDVTLAPAIGQTIGEVYLIVTATDGQGAAKADTAKISVN